MDDEFDALVSSIRERVEPSAAERADLETAMEILTGRVDEAVADLPVETEIIQVGSTARDTWLAGERDIDLFVRFPPSLDREKLETYGLKVGHEVLPDGQEVFAEHPYVLGEVEGFKIDLVPCYDIDDAANIKSAVDRTPFHTEYVEEHLTPELAEDVRVCKQFFTGIGVYGSDLKTRGFSGVLTELLVLEYDGFRPLIDAAAEWTPPVRFDPEDHGTESFDDPLVMIDPTDPGRNVAAVLSAANLARVQHFARELRREPRESLFFPESPEPFDEERVREEFDRRDTTPVAITFRPPDIVDDQLWPQLERSRRGIREELDRQGFDVFRTDVFVQDRAVLLFELSVAERPRVERHEGPPVHVTEHATRFYETYEDDDETYGPFIEDDRYVVEREREFSSAVAFLASDALFDVSLGTHITSALEDDYELLVDGELGTLAEEFGVEFARYLSPTPRG